MSANTNTTTTCSPTATYSSNTRTGGVDITNTLQGKYIYFKATKKQKLSDSAPDYLTPNKLYKIERYSSSGCWVITSDTSDSTYNGDVLIAHAHFKPNGHLPVGCYWSISRKVTTASQARVYNIKLQSKLDTAIVRASNKRAQLCE